jgi:type I restriction enzyme M protein
VDTSIHAYEKAGGKAAQELPHCRPFVNLTVITPMPRPSKTKPIQAAADTVGTAKSVAKKHGSPQSLNAAVKSICDIMRRSNCAGALQYVPELTWILFLRILDEREAREQEEAAALRLPFTPAITEPYRWRDWAAPESALRQDTKASAWRFVHDALLPHLKSLKDQPRASARQKVISEIMSGVDRSRIDSEKNFLDVLDKVHGLTAETVDDTHVFTLSQVYEGLLLKMGEKGNDGGQFFTPREVIRVMVRVVDPKIGETIYDPGCGTGGFLAQAYEYLREKTGGRITGPQLETLKGRTFYGREKDNAVYPIALANLVLHGIDEPRIWHGNTLTGVAAYAGLFKDAPEFFDVVMMNPPFGGKEGPAAQTRFDYKTNATQVLFLQDVLREMKSGSRCGIVLDEGTMFRTEQGFLNTKAKLLSEADVWCIVSLPGGVFTSAGAGVKTSLVFFTKGRPTEKIWYYDLSDLKLGKKSPLTAAHFAEFLALLPQRGESERSWNIDFAARQERAASEAAPHRERAAEISAAAKELEAQWNALKKAKAKPAAVAAAEEEWKATLREACEAAAKAEAIEAAVYDLKAVNPRRVSTVDRRSPAELLNEIAVQGRAVEEALARLRLDV